MTHQKEDRAQKKKRSASYFDFFRKEVLQQALED